MDASGRDLGDRIERAKLEAIKELAYGASHEINNPLANISARAQTLLRDESDPERRRALEAIDQQALRAHEMISDLMLFARPPQLVCGEFSPAGLAREVVDEFRDECDRRRVSLQLDVDSAPRDAWGDAVQWGVALQAVVRNAVEAIGADGAVSVKVAGPTAEDESVRWIVTDDGPGIGAAALTRMFDPFFSGREAGRGLGFGLSKCWRIVSEHGGRVIVESPAEGGAAVTLLLPPGGTDAQR